jgi:hypothetical protein
MNTSKTTRTPRILAHLRRREGIPHIRITASAAPPVDGQKCLLLGLKDVFAAVVPTVAVTVTLADPLTVAEPGIVQVGGSFGQE